MKRKKMSIKEAVTKALPRLSKDEVEQAGDRVWKRIEAELDKRKDELAWRSIYGDGWSVPALDEGDLRIVTAVQLLEAKATGDAVLRLIKKWTASPPLVSLGLDRLVAEGLLTSNGTGDPWKRSYQITQYGEGALHRAKVEGKQVVEAIEMRAEDLAEEGGAVPEKG